LENGPVERPGGKNGEGDEKLGVHDVQKRRKEVMKGAEFLGGGPAGTGEDRLREREPSTLQRDPVG